jgi:uncharacterized phage protein (TIGR01671 family)
MPKHRPVKFRALDGERMYYGIRAISFTGDGQLHRFMDADGVQRVLKALLHSTGLNDKSGREIWEGDILRCSILGRLTTIAWAEAYSGFQWCQTNADGDRVDFYGGVSSETEEVVGNVYENPELLAKQKKDGH